MSKNTHLSGTRKSAQKNNFLVLCAIRGIKIITIMMHQILGIKSTCRYEVTCSTYAIRSIEEKGILKGSVVSLKRVINCQPYFTL